MRILLPAIAGAALLASACGSDGDRPVRSIYVTVEPTPVPSATAIPEASGPNVAEAFAKACAARKAQPAPQAPKTVEYPADALLVSVFPRDLLLDERAVAEAKEVSDGSTITAQWNRTWDRPSTGNGAATRITNNVMLFLTMDEAKQAFDSTAAGDGGRTAIEGALRVRGATPEGMCITPVDIGPMGVDQQAAWRAEYIRGHETYTTYWVYLRVRNVRATLQTFAQVSSATEQPQLFEETKQLAAKQAAHLRTFPANTKPEDVKLQDP